MNLSIGNKIKALRKEHGITQEQLADSIGISFQAVSKWENNIALPDITLVPVSYTHLDVYKRQVQGDSHRTGIQGGPALVFYFSLDMGMAEQYKRGSRTLHDLPCIFILRKHFFIYLKRGTMTCGKGCKAFRLYFL